jgi:hypothetical protein
MAVPSDFFIDLDETKQGGVSYDGVVEVCVLGWGHRIV